MDRDREVATATRAKQIVKPTTVVIESSGIGFIWIAILARKGHGKLRFAMPPLMRSFGQNRQTASLPYPRAAIFIISGAVRFEQRLRVVAKVVAPIDPGVTAAADAQIVFDPALLQYLSQVFRPGEGEVLVPDADREELDLLVGLVGVVEQGGRPLLEIGGGLRI